ncbi:MAG: hypothetical protein ABWY92_11450 [Xanthobacteraceae bacterium]|jgi:hypothetical protein
MPPATRRRAVDIAVSLAAMLLLLAPALWNGFPLLQYDSGGYFARWYEGTLEESRSTVYGLFTVALARPNFWPLIVVQAAVTAWVVALVLRVHQLGRPLVLLVTVAALSVATTLPWLTDIVLTDIFFGLSVLALHLLVLRNDALARWERVALFVLIAFSAATHNATLAVLLALLAAGFIVALFDHRLVPFAGLARGAAALLLGAIMLVGANYLVAKRLAWTPGGIGLTFGRMLQDGIVKRYLDEHCPDPRLRLCDHRDELPTDADVFFWGQGLFDRLGRFQGLNDEMRTIVLESLRAYPWLQLQAAAVATLKQLVMVRTGWGVLDSIWHTHGMIENFAPAMLPAMKAARQQRGELDFTAINDLHVPVALASMLLLLAVMALGVRQRRFADLGLLAATTALAILGNAFVTGALSGPHDRYGARVAWLATLLVAMVPWRAYSRGRSMV